MIKQHRGTIKQPMDLNVYEAAKARIRFCLENFDEVVCNYSGGKDSMVVALLCKEVMDELGIDKKLKVVFYDEEFVYPETLEAVDAMFALPWVEGYRLCLPMEYQLTLPDGQEKDMYLWDTSRPLMRPIPPDAILTDHHYAMTEAEEAVRDMIFNKPEDQDKKIVQLLGIRCQESITRLSTILASYKKGTQCFLRKTNVLNIVIGSPIYDWQTEDVFYYIKNQDVLELNKLYFLEMLARRPLRVSPPIHTKQRLHLHTIKIKNPQFYEMILKVFPDLDTVMRYAGDLQQYNDYDAMIKKYGLTVKGIKNLIVGIIPSEEIRLYAFKQYKKFLRDYMEFDRYLKYGHTYESALRVCFIDICKGNFGKTIMLRNKVDTKRELLAREELENGKVTK